MRINTLQISMAIVALSLIFLVGCRDKPTLPTTHPVHGKVVWKDGTPLKGGAIQFQSEADPSVSASGVIEDDGSFTLSSFKAGIRAAGAVAGPNRILIIPSKRKVSTPPQSYTVKPGDNQLKLVVE